MSRQPNLLTIIHLRDFADTVADDGSLPSERGAARCGLQPCKASVLIGHAQNPTSNCRRWGAWMADSRIPTEVAARRLGLRWEVNLGVSLGPDSR